VLSLTLHAAFPAYLARQIFVFQAPLADSHI
jgi:hypothetical protein